MEIVVKDLIELIDLKQGLDTTVIDVQEITPIADFIFIITANSSVHLKSLGKYVVDFFVEKKMDKFLSSKSTNFDNNWVLIDGGEIIVNLFLKDVRDFYSLEKLYYKGKIIKS
jgi:ribosome-associated protein